MVPDCIITKEISKQMMPIYEKPIALLSNISIDDGWYSRSIDISDLNIKQTLES